METIFSIPYSRWKEALQDYLDHRDQREQAWKVKHGEQETTPVPSHALRGGRILIWIISALLLLVLLYQGR